MSGYTIRARTIKLRISFTSDFVHIRSMARRFNIWYNSIRRAWNKVRWALSKLSRGWNFKRQRYSRANFVHQSEHCRVSSDSSVACTPLHRGAFVFNLPRARSSPSPLPPRSWYNHLRRCWRSPNTSNFQVSYPSAVAGWGWFEWIALADFIRLSYTLLCTIIKGEDIPIRISIIII